MRSHGLSDSNLSFHGYELVSQREFYKCSDTGGKGAWCVLTVINLHKSVKF